MLTPIEVQSKTFKSGGLGYDKKDVDAFFREVLSSFESAYRENLEMKDRIENLNQAVQYYKSIEKTLQKALVLAEKTSEDTKSAALKEAELIKAEAHVKAQQIINEANNELDRIHSQTIALLQQYEKYKLQYKSLAASQLELLESECFDFNMAKLEALIDTDAVKQDDGAAMEEAAASNEEEDSFDFISLTEEK